MQLVENSSKIDRNSYLAGLLETISQTSNSQTSNSQTLNSPEWLKTIHAHASAVVEELAIPTTRDEEWRFTDISPLLQVKFEAAKQLNVPLNTLTTLPEAAKSRLVFVNGIYAPELSAIADLPEGLFIGNLATALNTPSLQNIIPDYLAKQPGNQEIFTALNTVGLTDAAVVWVSKNKIVEKPIHLLFLSTVKNTPTISQPRCLIVAEANSSVTLVEEYVSAFTSQANIPYFTNSVTEIWLGENAKVNHARVQQESGASFHIGKNAISQARNSQYKGIAINLGGKISRHNLEIFQTGEATETTLNGLTMIAAQQLADTHSLISLNHPHSNSRQLHKCIVDDKARAVFNGKIFVPKRAQLTDAGQLSRNLLLSPKARVDTKPQLEITADNVKCSHGATVSQLDSEEIFYLQSRGLNANDARNLLIDAFAVEIINELPVKSLGKLLARCVACRADSLEVCR